MDFGPTAPNVGTARLGVEKQVSFDAVAFQQVQKIARTGDLEKAAKEQSRLWRITLMRGGQQINVTLGG